MPASGTPEHSLFDQLVLGRVERFDDDGPCYAWVSGKRLGAFETDTAAREAVMDHAFAEAIERHLRKQCPEHLCQADENDSLVKDGPDGLLKAKACVALSNSAHMLRRS